MRRTTLIAGMAGATIVLGGGIALAYDGEGAPSTAPGRPAVTPSTSTSTPPAPTGPAARTAIDRAEAVRIALRTVPGGRIESIERETEHGRPVWEIDVIAGGAEHDLDIDAQTGKVLRHKTDHETKTRDDRDHDDSGHDD